MYISVKYVYICKIFNFANLTHN